MAVSFFDDKNKMPDDGMVAGALADTYPLWAELQSHVQSEYPNIAGEWKHYGKAAGWSYKLLSKKRNLLFFVPLDGCFRIRIVLGEKAVACAEAADLPDDIKDAIRAATLYTEGRSIDIDINHREQMETVEKLLRIKFDN
jgi:hypothetical protein